MLLRLSEHIANCLEHAAQAEQRARDATDSATRSDNEVLARSWRHLARSYQFVESLERFLPETARAEVIVPPELPSVADEQPVQPDSKPIIRRHRVKHETSFKERLLKSAQEARELAAGLPAGPARERILQKARRSETAAEIDTWLSLPGSPPSDSPDPTKKPRA